MLKLVLAMALLVGFTITSELRLAVPSLSGPLTLDGVLETTDPADLAVALAPRRVLLTRMVDGSNRLVPMQESLREYTEALKASPGAEGNRGSSVHVQILEDAADRELAGWITQQIHSK